MATAQHPIEPQGLTSTPPLWRTIAHFVFGDLGVGTAARLVVALIVLSGLLIANYQGWSLQLAWTTAVIASYAAILVTSPAIRSRFQQQDFMGYWRYQNRPDAIEATNTFEQATDRNRYVKIDRDDGKLRIRGWLCGEWETRLFEASRVVLTGFGKKSGYAFYWYESPEDAPQSRRFFGIVVLSWDKESSAAEVQQMSGRYYGHESNSMGTVIYRRISEQEFVNAQAAELDPT